jgi:hypothetical protein
LQQAGSSDTSNLDPTPDSDPSEVEARSVSEAVSGGGQASPIQTAVTLSRKSISRQLDPHAVYCAIHAAVCLSLSENPPAAALCWANFAARCSGGSAAAEQPAVDTEVASAGGGGMAEAEQAST